MNQSQLFNLNQWLITIKNYYVDTVDPEGAIVKTSFRTALACAVSILLLQFYGNLSLSAWAGFATFAFVQNDLQDLFFNRLKFLMAIILVFTGFTFLGMLLSQHLIAFLISVPLVVFICAFSACLGFPYFNAGAWTLFLYILAGATQSNVREASQIAVTFLICGVISLVACFLIFPIRPYQKIILNYRRMLSKILLLLQHGAQNHKRYFIQFNLQLDRMLELQEKNLSQYLELKQTSSVEQTSLIQLSKSIYQIGLMVKSIVYWQQRVSNTINYSESGLEGCKNLLENALQTMII
ncbi:MAG: hypothetical protein JSR33_11005, partial [Proteobacteria bacterium]|nr:hypothetical protein [Pseudomonadota bacterium]